MVSGDVDSIMMGILRIALKSFVECVRLQTLSRNGYQQIQVDMYFLALILRPFAALDDDIFDRFIEEICISAEDRCIDPAPTMDPTVRCPFLFPWFT